MTRQREVMCMGSSSSSSSSSSFLLLLPISNRTSPLSGSIKWGIIPGTNFKFYIAVRLAVAVVDFAALLQWECGEDSDEICSRSIGTAVETQRHTVKQSK